MRILSTIIIILLLSLQSSLIGQKTEDSLIVFSDEVVSSEEFKRVYLKNNSGELIQKSTVDEYLDLYIVYKLKVKEASRLGYDTVGAFKRELQGYREQLAKPYLSDEKIIDDLTKESYERLKYEVRASHILIASNENDLPEDTLKAYKRAQEVQKKLKRGDKFESIAFQYSDDPSVKVNKGDLGYFSAFYMVYPFESAAYKTKVGEISNITRTRFGYHVLKVTDKRPSNGEITAAHILVSTDPDIATNANPEEKINEIYSQLENGESFDLLARQFSDDKRSANNGGRLAPFRVGRMVPEFEKEAFKLEKDGEYSKPFKTDYGWHIVLRISKSEIQPYEKMEPFLRNKVKNDSRSQLTKISMLKSIKEQYGFREYNDNIDTFYEIIDSSYFSGNRFPDSENKLTKELFEIGNQKFSQGEFLEYLNQNQEGTPMMSIPALVNSKYKVFQEKSILDYKSSKLEEEYEDFKFLIREYHDGILLFNITNDMVWDKAIKDTLGLEKFLKDNQTKYKWGQRAEATVYSILNEEIYREVESLISNGVDEDSIVEVVNRSSQLNIRLESGKYEKTDNELVDNVNWKKGIYNGPKKDSRLTLIHIKEVLKPSNKTLEDSKGIITSDYQSYLEKKWVEELKSEYEYKVYDDSLNQIKEEL